MKFHNGLSLLGELLCASIVVIFLTAFCLQTALTQETERQWSDKTKKFNVAGTMVDFDKRTVTIKTEEQPKLIVPISKLCDADQKYVRGTRILQQEQRQYDLVMPHLDRYRESPYAVVEILEAIHREIPDAPYAASMIGLAHASGKADYKTAEKYFRIAERSIKETQAIFGEEFHQTTATAVGNNLAVCACKSGQGDQAARLFARQVESDSSHKVQFCVYHNATLMMEYMDQGNSNLTLSSGNRRKLAGALALKQPENPGFEVPAFFLYLLEWDMPITRADFEDVVAGGKLKGRRANLKGALNGSVFQTEKQLKDKGFSEHSQGTGFLVGPDLVVTNRHVIQSKSNELSYTITQYSEDGVPNLIGGSIIKWSPVLEEDLALIKLDKTLGNSPLPIATQDAEESSEVAVIGFPKAFESGEHLIASGGKVERVDEEIKQLPWYELSCKMAPGNSGSPCLDMKGNVVGIAFAIDSEEFNKYRSRFSRRSYAVKSSALVQFIKSVKPDFKFPETRTDPYSSRLALTDGVRGSALLVKSWIPPTERFEVRQPLFGEKSNYQRGIAQLATLKENSLYPDDWCPFCRGTTKTKCTNRLCVRGQIEKRKSYLAGYVPNTREPIYKIRRYFERCPTCKGNNQLKCQHCRDGKIGGQ